jgi:hypothetical protein
MEYILNMPDRQFRYDCLPFAAATLYKAFHPRRPDSFQQLTIPLSEQRHSWNSDCVYVYKIPGCRSGLNLLKPKRPVSLAVITA